MSGDKTRPPLQVGDWAAMGLRSGRCPVGRVESMDQDHIAIRTVEFLVGTLTEWIYLVPRSELEMAMVAYPPLEDMPDYWLNEMGNFQTRWAQEHSQAAVASEDSTE